MNMTGGESVALTQLRPNALTERRGRRYESTYLEQVSDFIPSKGTLSSLYRRHIEHSLFIIDFIPISAIKNFWGILSDTTIVFAIYCNGKFYKI